MGAFSRRRQPADTSGPANWGDHAWARPPRATPPRSKLPLIIGCSIVGAVLLLVLLGNLGGGDEKSTSVTTTTVTVAAPPSTVTVTAAAPPPVTITQAAPPQAPGLLAPPPVGVPAPSASVSAPRPSAYYDNCADARAAGAAPLYAGEPGYRSDLDRDGNGVACEN